MDIWGNPVCFSLFIHIRQMFQKEKQGGSYCNIMISSADTCVQTMWPILLNVTQWCLCHLLSCASFPTHTLPVSASSLRLKSPWHLPAVLQAILLPLSEEVDAFISALGTCLPQGVCGKNPCCLDPCGLPWFREQHFPQNTAALLHQSFTSLERDVKPSAHFPYHSSVKSKVFLSLGYVNPRTRKASFSSDFGVILFSSDMLLKSLITTWFRMTKQEKKT